VGKTYIVTPVSSSDGDDVSLGHDDGTLDGDGNFLTTLSTETNVSVGVTNSDVSLESGSLTGSSHLLDGHNLDDFVLEGLTEEVINDLELLDGDGEEEDLF